MFVDMSFFAVTEGHEEHFERAFATVVQHAREAEGCLSSDLVRLSEERLYCWVERWISRDAHLAFNEFLFGQMLPGIAGFDTFVIRQAERDAEGIVVHVPARGSTAVR